jgi:hypothetical protein
MAEHQPVSNAIDQTQPDRTGGSYLQVQYLSWRRHPLWGPLTRADWLVMLYGAASGLAFSRWQTGPSLMLAGILAFVGFFSMLVLVGLTKVLLIWQYMRIPLVLIRAAKIYLVGFLVFGILIAAANGDWSIAAVLTWVVLPLLLLCWQPTPGA